MSDIEKAKALIALLNVDLPHENQIELDIESMAFALEINGDQVIRFNTGDITLQLIAFLTGLMWGIKIPKKQPSPPKPR